MRLIHQENFSIARAAKATNIPYDNAKAINRTYVREERVAKIDYKQRYQTRRINKKNGAQNFKLKAIRREIQSNSAEINDEVLSEKIKSP